MYAISACCALGSVFLIYTAVEAFLSPSCKNAYLPSDILQDFSSETGSVPLGLLGLTENKTDPEKAWGGCKEPLSAFWRSALPAWFGRVLRQGPRLCGRAPWHLLDATACTTMPAPWLLCRAGWDEEGHMDPCLCPSPRPHRCGCTSHLAGKKSRLSWKRQKRDSLSLC